MINKDFLIAAAEMRKLTIKAMAKIGYGHIGGSMSIIDLLAVLYTGVLKINPKEPNKKDRDWVIMSKGHCGPALYSALCYKGYFAEEELMTLNQNGSSIPSHCDRLKTVGIDISTGSLGQGISLGMGVALGNKMQGINTYSYIILGDGELQEGQIWEGVQFAAHHNLDNVIIFVDNNRRQLDGTTEEVCKSYDLKGKFEAFGLTSFQVDGHNTDEIYKAINKAKSVNKPSVIILDTEKGHGCCFSEIKGFNHYMVISEEMANEAIKDIDARLRAAL